MTLENHSDTVDSTLDPLFEQPIEWFQDLISCYETAFGPTGEIHDLSPEGVVFRAAVYDEVTEYRQELVEKWRQNNFINGRQCVSDKETAANQSNRTIWLNEFGHQIEIFERIPFDQRVTTPDELQNTLDDHLIEQPQWDELFEEAECVVTEL
mgnify:FL=1